MDFIARAGSLIDRGHRVIGLMLVIIIFQFGMLLTEKADNRKKQETIEYMNSRRSIYVVPNSFSGIYKPAEDKLLLSAFVDNVTQSLLTYTPATVLKQFNSVKIFMSPRLLEEAENFYLNEIKKSRVERLSSLFVIDKTSTELSEFEEISSSRGGDKTYAITVKGIRNNIIGGKVIEENDMEIKMHIQSVPVSKTNPFGFILTKIDMSKIRTY